jgi:uncharacterized protein YfbU (UPF0304 family)
MKLTKAERLILANQYRILGLLNPDELPACNRACEILQQGYTLEYSSLPPGLDTNIAKYKCVEVTEVLNMYRALKIAARDLPPGALSAEDAKFQGFDGNHETEHFQYARFLLDTPGFHDESKEDARNSHRRMLPLYRRMLAAWKQSQDRWQLTPDDIARILPHTGQ